MRIYVSVSIRVIRSRGTSKSKRTSIRKLASTSTRTNIIIIMRTLICRSTSIILNKKNVNA